jgi:pimeloyl-ACP methyl ester carboxylesterase
LLDLPEPDRAELVDLGRAVLRCWEWGAVDAPPVVLVHGAYDHGRMFDGLAPRLADAGFRAVAVDLRGHGDSSPLDTGFAWALMITDLALLVGHLGAGPVPFVAHSFGSGLTMGLAGARPDLVSALVSLDGLGPPAAALGAPSEGLREAVQREFDRADRDLLGAPRSFASVEELAARRLRATPRLGDGWALHLARHGTRPAPGGGWVWKADPRFAAAVPSDFDIDMFEVEMRLVRCPVLVLWGTEPDTWRDLTDEEAAERATWLGARIVPVPDAGHYVHIEQPDLVADETVHLLRGLP